jgi:hypothetical protein
MEPKVKTNLLAIALSITIWIMIILLVGWKGAIGMAAIGLVLMGLGLLFPTRKGG